MAVTTTPEQILVKAYSHSTKNAPGVIVAETTEGLQIVNQAIQGLYSLAARINREHFGDQATVAFAAGSWARPVAAESIYRIQKDDGSQVVVVPFDDRTMESGRPAVYYFGQKYFGAGNASDPTSGNLIFFFSRRPTLSATWQTALDAMWEEQYNELLALEVAIYLAMKDGRVDEVAMLKGMRDGWLLKFVAFLEHAEAGERRRFNHARRFNSAGMVPVSALVAGGTDLKLG